MSTETNYKKIFLMALIISLSISALLGIIIFIVGNIGEIQFRILMTTLIIGGFSLTGLACATLLDKKRYIQFAILGIIISILGFIYNTLVVWEIIKIVSSYTFKIMIISIILAFSTAHSSLLLLINSEKKSVNISLKFTILFIVLVALYLIAMTINDYSNYGDVKWRTLGVLAVLDVLGTIVTPLLLKVSKI